MNTSVLSNQINFGSSKKFKLLKFIKIAPFGIKIWSHLVKTAILNILNIINGFSILNNPQNHPKIVQIDQVVAKLLILLVIMLIYANFANKKNCSTYASRHPSVSKWWTPLLYISNIKVCRFENFRVHNGALWAGK